MCQTPLVNALRAFAAEKTLRLHMPGHQGKALPLAELAGYAAIDFTELPPTGDLYAPGGPIEAAEALWAKAYGMEHALFLTGGSTQGVLAAMTLAARPGEGVLLDRGCHRSVYNALALLDLKPTYLTRPWRAAEQVNGPISPQDVDKILKEQPNIKTVCITSPTYYGVLSDVAAISAEVHARGGKLVVDAAHGAHLPFLGENPYAAADLVVLSAHKTLPAPGQTALLCSGEAYPMDALRAAASIYGSSSPSYPMMAALDAARAYMEERGAGEYRSTAEAVQALRRSFPSLGGSLPLDPTRFVLCCPDGFALQGELEKRGIYPEMADKSHVVFILSCATGQAELERLRSALEHSATAPCPDCVVPPPPPLPAQVLRPRAALFAPRRTVLLKDAEGCIAAQQIAPYPPGVPIVAPGERIGKKQLSYLLAIEYNGNTRIGVL